MKTSWLLGASVFALGIGGALPTAVAQESDGEEAVARQDVVVITATRREGSVQDVPINVAAVGAAQIEEQGISELSDLLSFVPGINVVDRGARQGNPIIVRGINADPIGPGDGDNSGGGTVATYLGEVPLFIDLKLNDMERVEVLETRQPAERAAEHCLPPLDGLDDLLKEPRVQLVAEERLAVGLHLRLDGCQRVGPGLTLGEVLVFEPLNDLVGRNVEDAVQVDVQLGARGVVGQRRDEPSVEVLAVATAELAKVAGDAHSVGWRGALYTATTRLRGV